MNTVNFQRVTARRERRGKCPECNKATKRSETFEMTVNPFNRNPDGTVRTQAEVWLAVNERADQWEPDFTHEKCKGVES